MTHSLPKQVFPQYRHWKQIICPRWHALNSSCLFFLSINRYTWNIKSHHPWYPILYHLGPKLSQLKLCPPCQSKLLEASICTGKTSSHLSPNSGFSCSTHGSCSYTSTSICVTVLLIRVRHWLGEKQFYKKLVSLSPG